MRRTKSLIRQTRFVPCARIEDQLSEEISMSVETSSEQGARDQIDANAAGVLFWTDVYGTQTSESGEAMDKSCMVKTQLWIPSAVQITFRCEAIVVVSSKCPPFVGISLRELYFTLRTDSFLPPDRTGLVRLIVSPRPKVHLQGHIQATRRYPAQHDRVKLILCSRAWRSSQSSLRMYRQATSKGIIRRLYASFPQASNINDACRSEMTTRKARGRCLHPTPPRIRKRPSCAM